MINLESEYKEFKEKRKKICSEIVKLEDSADVMKYKKLININRKMKAEEDRIYKAMKLEEYGKCNHILVVTDATKQASLKGDYNYSYCGCIKCGLDEQIAKYLPNEIEKLKADQKIQYEYLFKHQFHINGKETNIPCSVDLGNCLYEEIMDKNKDKALDDETLIELFKIAYFEEKTKTIPEEPPKTK